MLQILADLAPLNRVDGDERVVLSVRDRKVLDIEAQQVQLELGASAGLGVLELDLQEARVSVGLQGDRVVSVGELHHLGKVDDVDAEDDIVVAAVGLEALHAEVQRDEGDMGRVYGLERDAYKNQYLFARICQELEFAAYGARVHLLTCGANVQVDVVDEVLDGLDDLFEDEAFREFRFEHFLSFKFDFNLELNLIN